MPLESQSLFTALCLINASAYRLLSVFKKLKKSLTPYAGCERHIVCAKENRIYGY